MIKTNLWLRLRLAFKILRTKGYSDGYTIEELIEDDY